MVEFDFLGKDSIRYFNQVAVEKRVFKNLQLFMNNKQPKDDLFDRLDVSTHATRSSADTVGATSPPPSLGLGNHSTYAGQPAVSNHQNATQLWLCDVAVT